MKRLLFFVFTTLLPWVSMAQSASIPAPVFRSHDPLEIRLEADFFTLTRDRGEEASEHPARLIYQSVNGQDMTLELDLETRGNFRNRERVCDFPPLWLDFPRSELDNTLFEGENRIKLVTHCRRAGRYEQYVALEYLAYRILNLMTDYSLNVRYLSMHYVDGESGRTIARKPGFIIEHKERLAERMELQLLDVERVDREKYDTYLLTLVSVYQYLIGNTDWSAVEAGQEDECCHNIYPAMARDSSIIPLAYDFDATGIVNPGYSRPQSSLNLNSFRDRLYRNTCPEPAMLDRVLQEFREKREAIFALLDNPVFSATSVRNSRSFFRSFYATVDDPEASQEAFFNYCP